MPKAELGATTEPGRAGQPAKPRIGHWGRSSDEPGKTVMVELSVTGDVSSVLVVGRPPHEGDKLRRADNFPKG